MAKSCWVQLDEPHVVGRAFQPLREASHNATMQKEKRLVPTKKMSVCSLNLKKCIDSSIHISE